MPLLVPTMSGPVRGFVDSLSSSRQFLGVPYADPPTRWKNPSPLTPWNGTKNTTKYGPACYQLRPVNAKYEVSEDCLYLDVYSPLAADSLLPVLVYIFGGSFQVGYSEGYDSAARALQMNVINVVINYRLNSFGFLSGLTGIDYNIGLKDQQMALQWVKENIVFFGGDPLNIVINGESAGASSIMFHLVMPSSSEGLFNGAILESSASPIIYECNSSLYQSRARSWASSLGCNGSNIISCLEKVDSSRVLAIYETWVPCIDYQVISAPPLLSFKEGSYQDVPIIHGFNSDEGNLFAVLFGSPGNITDQEYEKVTPLAITSVLFLEEDYVPEIMTWYNPARKTLGNWNTLSRIIGDGLFNCPLNLISSEVSKTNQKYYRYLFRHHPHNSVYPQLNATHGLEIPFFFGNSSLLGYLSPPLFTQEEEMLSLNILTLLSQFMYTKDPSPEWPPLNSGYSYVFDIPPTTINSIPLFSYCVNWESLYLKIHGK
uniref:Carboxylic ester hydrolase n=1 Tax=Arcella intermedia TaxID=1963864 RepID=A0A6B2L2J3_9EUKA